MRLSAAAFGHGGGAMRPGEEVAVHQLLGRIAYFHVLFIEPALASAPRPAPGVLCCNHRAPPPREQPPTSEPLDRTAWAVLDELASAFGTPGSCPGAGPCCAACRVASCAADLAETWMATERRAYHLPEPDEPGRRACRDAAAGRLSRAFTRQHTTTCRNLPATDTTAPDLLPGPDELPLTGELLTLWQDPLPDDAPPVVSWLNHCTDLDDIRRVLDARRTTS